jgi:uncharacterized membrane protein YczE
MREAPLLRGPFAVRVVGLFLGLFVIAAAIVAMLGTDLGVPPWDVLQVGIANHTPLEIGTASIVVGIAVLGIVWALGATPGFGTVANAIGIGLFVQILLDAGVGEQLADRSLGIRIVALLVAIEVFGLGTALYVGAGMGAGPRDSMMLALSKRTGRAAGSRSCGARSGHRAVGRVRPGRAAGDRHGGPSRC